MWDLMIEGGYPMWFLLLFGLAGLAAAIGYARKPTVDGLRRIYGLGATTVFSIFTGTAADIAAVGHKAPEYVKTHPGTNLSDVVLLGLGESMSPCVLGFSLLTITALIVTVGLYRSTRVD